MKRRDGLLNEYHVGDARRITELLGSKRVDVTVTSPPYWDLKDYDSSQQIGFGQTYANFLDDLTAVFDAIWTCTKPSGSLWLVVDTIKKSGQVHLFPFDLLNRLTGRLEKAWHLQDILIWQKPHTLPWAHRAKLQGHFEYILCLSKSKQLRLNLDALRTTNGLANWWVKYPERYHPLGKSLGNVWEYPIPTQGTWGNGHFAHFCPMPIEMAQRIVLLSTQSRSQVVLDPFAGTGPVLVAAQSLGRRWVGLDVNQQFRQMFYRRLAHEAPEAAAAKPQQSFGPTNLRLRQLKYAIQLYKRVAPSERLTTDDIPLLLVVGGTHLRAPSPSWVKGCRVVIIVNDSMPEKRLERLRSAVEQARTRAPFTKYQVDVGVTIRRRSDLAVLAKEFGRKRIFRYTQGHFWRSSPAERQQLVRNRIIRLPDLVSDISVNERPAY